MYTALIQVRTSSSRFPSKVTKKILNHEVFLIVYKRVLRSKLISKAIIITSNNKSDDIIFNLCEKKNIPVYRGSLNDVLARFYFASKKFKIKDIVRITSDCPLIDPMTIDKVCKIYSKNKYDYVSNTIKPTFPDGLDVEIFNFKTLEKTFKKFKSKYNREHVTTGMQKNKEIKKKNVKNKINLSNFRFTLDTKKDYLKIKEIFNKYKSIYKPNFGILKNLINKNKTKYKFIRK